MSRRRDEAGEDNPKIAPLFCSDSERGRKIWLMRHGPRGFDETSLDFEKLGFS